MKPYFSFQWHITDRCDQRCKHCYIFNSEHFSHIHEMSWEEIEQTFENCLDFCRTYQRTPYFYVTGGDPILHPDFWRLLEMLKEHQIPFTILGNPFHLSEEVCLRLKDLGCERYQMSLDGLEKTHDWFRKPGSYRQTLEKIELLNKSGIRSVLMATVSSTNRKEIPDLMDVAVQAKADVFAFGRYCPNGKEMDAMMTPQEYRQLLEECDAKMEDYARQECSTYFSKKDHLWTLYDYEKGTFHIPANLSRNLIYDGCNCGNCHLTICANGDVFACRRAKDSKAGNVLQDRLADLWIHEMEAYRNYAQFKKCSHCELLRFCRGCPAVARGFTGDFYEADPQCWKQIDPEMEEGICFES